MAVHPITDLEKVRARGKGLCAKVWDVHVRWLCTVCDIIEFPIVLDKVQITIFLFHEKHWGTRGFGWTDSTISEVLLDESIQFLLFCW